MIDKHDIEEVSRLLDFKAQICAYKEVTKDMTYEDKIRYNLAMWRGDIAMFDDDICWCADSDRCKNKNCFRHMSNRRHYTEGPDIFTCAKLMGTDICPLDEDTKA